MGSHAPGNTAGREGEREGGGEEAPSRMDSGAHLAGGSWCCSLLQSPCQRQDTGLAAAISSSKCQLPCLSARDGCAAMGTLTCAPQELWLCALSHGLAEPPECHCWHWGGRARRVQAPASAAGVVWHPGPLSCTPGSEAHPAWGAAGVPHSPEVCDVLMVFTQSSAQTQLCPEVQPHSSPSF